MANHAMNPNSTIVAASTGSDSFRAACIAAATALGVADGDAELGTEVAIAAGRGSHRVYHDTGHFEELAKGSPELVAVLKEPSRAVEPQLAERLGNLYTLVGRDHDVAYVALDRGIPEALEKTAGRYLEKSDDGTYRIRSDATGENIALAMAVFGYSPGQALQPFNGQNEFISAVHSLEVNRGIRPADKASLALMINQTIPFLSPDSIERSMERVRSLPLITSAEADALGMAAAHFANRDVINFAEPRQSFFVNTIRLMREGGVDFSNPENIADKALRTAAFFTGLRADVEAGRKIVFRNYGKLMTPDELAGLNARACQQMADSITGMKVLAVAVHPEKAQQLAQELKLDLSTVTESELKRGQDMLAEAYRIIVPCPRATGAAAGR